MKKIFKFLSLLILLSSAAVCQTTVSIDKITGVIGDSVIISVYSTAVNNVKDFTFHISYDRSSVQYGRVVKSTSPLPDSDKYLFYIERDGVITVSYINTVPVSLNGKLFDIKVKFVDGFSEFRFEYARIRDITGNRFNLQLENGSLSQTVDPRIKLFSPNGGEYWEVVGEPQEIKWASVYLNNIEIDYSVDNGTSWIEIADDYDASLASYTWTIPNVTSNTCRVRILSSADSTVVDASNNVFTINSDAEITLTAPNGGEILKAGGVKRIKWTSKNVTNVKIEYSTNANDPVPTWNTVAPSLPSSGEYYDWLIPNTPSTDCKIRLSDTGSPAVFDMSNALFEITTTPVPVTISDVVDATLRRIVKVSGSGNEAYFWGARDLWQKEDNPLTLDTGDQLFFRDTLILSGEVPLTVGWLTAVNRFVLKVLFNPSTVQPDSIIFVDDDLGNYSYSSEDNVLTINWFNSEPVDFNGKLLDIRFNYTQMIDPDQWIDPALWTIDNLTTKPFAFETNAAIPSVVLDPANFSELQVLSFEIENSQNDLISDLSFTDGSLAITNSSSVKIITPRGGEVWGVNDGTKKIEWESVFTNNVRLRYSNDNGGSWNTIVASIAANPGSYDWTLPNINSSTCKLLILNVDDASVVDVSEVFTITNTKTLELISPNGGEIIKSGDDKIIKWNSTNISNVKLEYTLNDGTNWVEIEPDIPAISFSYTWSAPVTVSDLCRVRITDAADVNIFDVSDGLFSISDGLIHISIPDTNVAAGSHFVPIRTTWADDVSYMKFNVSFDKNIITFDKVEPSPQLKNTGSFISYIRDGIISVTWFSTEPIECSGVLCDLYFTYNSPLTADLTFHSGSVKDSEQLRLDIQLNDGSVSPPLVPLIIPVVVSPSNLNSVPIEFGQLASVKSMDLEIKYDDESLDLSEISSNSEELSSFTYNCGSGIVHINWSDDLPANLQGQLFDMKFEYKNAGTTDNQFSEFRFKKVEILNEIGQQVGVTTTNGSISQNEQPAVKLFSPNGGEIWRAGLGTGLVEWGSVFMSTASIYLTTDGGINWEPIAESIDVDNLYYEYVVPGIFSNECKIKIVNDLDSDIYDESNGFFTITSITGITEEKIPTEFNLKQNFPNPFNPATNIRYELPAECMVNLTVYNLLGERVETVVDELKPAGFHEVNWTARNYASGVYFYRLIAGDYTSTKKMILIR